MFQLYYLYRSQLKLPKKWLKKKGKELPQENRDILKRPPIVHMALKTINKILLEGEL